MIPFYCVKDLRIEDLPSLFMFDVLKRAQNPDAALVSRWFRAHSPKPYVPSETERITFTRMSYSSVYVYSGWRVLSFNEENNSLKEAVVWHLAHGTCPKLALRPIRKYVSDTLRIVRHSVGKTYINMYFSGRYRTRYLVVLRSHSGYLLHNNEQTIIKKWLDRYLLK